MPKKELTHILRTKGVFIKGRFSVSSRLNTQDLGLFNVVLISW